MPKHFESWQFWSAAKKLLGESNLLRILGRRNGRTIRMYSADPKYTIDRCRDPLQHLHIIFSELDTFGRGDVARLAIKYLQTAVDHDSQPDVVADLQPTIDAEILADFQAVSDLKNTIDNRQTPEVVKAALVDAIHELERTYAKYLQDN